MPDANLMILEEAALKLRTLLEEVVFVGGLSIRAITAPYFLGTKIEAFRGQGDRDFYSSRDLEDLFRSSTDVRPCWRRLLLRPKICVAL